MKSSEIREKFLKYFEKNKHSIVPSSSLVPEGDNTLLFTNAGMNQFKNVFLGFDKRNYVRATTSQKCVRAGGKHNDLEQVGVTARHHTFFEMLGNFSFGDYFKKEAIHFAWEFLTKELKLPKDKLYVTVFETDDEAAEIWHKQEGVPKDRIFRYGEKDNFWRMGETGPCGPCSEIFYDHGPKAGSTQNPNAKFGEDEQRYVEIWNLVFMQFFEEAPGKMTPLPKPSVDTGAGLERLSAVLQGVYMNYDTDLFLPIIHKTAEVSKTKYGQSKEHDTALRVIADHARSISFLIADGVLPNNEGRGYVLRRIMRRAIRFGRKLSTNQSVLVPAAQEVISQMKEAYPELQERANLILDTIRSEENSFLKTLDQGTEILNQEIKKIKKENETLLSGEFIFKLYDTFGFPLDLTRLMCAEEGVLVDDAGFEIKMEEARKKSKASWKGHNIGADQGHLIEISQSVPQTQFLGYESLVGTGKVLALSDGHKAIKKLSKGDSGILVLDQTVFYAEGGGQVGDTGEATRSQNQIQIFDCTKQNGVFFHHILVEEGEVTLGDNLNLRVSSSKRRETQAHHSATHLLHAALRKTLGTHVTQAGSLVDSEHLRFDFTHDKSLSSQDIKSIEDLVNENIALSHPVNPQVMAYKDAIKTGAMALFGEKYGDEVRVLKMGDFSIELCGGTHVTNTSQIRLFKVISESSVSRGVRRIEALAGNAALQYLLKEHEEFNLAKNSAQVQGELSLHDWIENKKSEIKFLEKTIEKSQSSSIDIPSLAKSGIKFSKGILIFTKLPIEDRKLLSDISDKILDQIKTGIVITFGQSPSGSQEAPLIVNVSKEISKDYMAGKLIKECLAILGGKGGGRPDFAQGSVESLDQFDQAKERILSILQ